MPLNDIYILPLYLEYPLPLGQKYGLPNCDQIDAEGLKILLKIVSVSSNFYKVYYRQKLVPVNERISHKKRH